LFPDALIPALAILIPSLELIVALAAFMPLTAPYAMGTAGGLLAAYGLAMGVNLARGRNDIDCGCFGPAKRQTLNGWLVARNIVLLPAALVGAATLNPRTFELLDFFLCGFAVFSATILYAVTSQLIANAPHLNPIDFQTEHS
jgi:hypothetical protein